MSATIIPLRPRALDETAASLPQLPDPFAALPGAGALIAVRLTGISIAIAGGVWAGATLASARYSLAVAGAALAVFGGCVAATREG